MTTTTLSVGSLAPPVRALRVSAVPTLTLRRLALTVRTPRSLVAPLLTPVLFALVIGVVFIWMLPVIHDSSPGSAMTISPGCSVISKTGKVVPIMR